MTDWLSRIPIKGFIEASLSDYPFGEPAAVIFLGGCNLRCRYCQAAHLVVNLDSQPSIALESVFAALNELRGFVRGITLTGGEPTVHPGLESLLRRIKRMGYRIKLDTWGNAPDRIDYWIAAGLLDALAVDIKGPFESYERIAGRRPALKNIETIREWVLSLIRTNRVPVEFRITVHRSLLTREDVLVTAAQVRGAATLVLQQYRPVKGFDQRLALEPTYSDSELDEIAHDIQRSGLVHRCFVRGHELEDELLCAS